MSVSQSSSRSKQRERPAPCRQCGREAWWNGVRRVKEVVREALGALRHVVDVVRWRARCSDRACPAGSWTVYAPGSYPHRRYALPVVVSAVSAVAFGGATLDEASTEHACDRRSVGRWVRWVANLLDPTELARTCARLDGTGVAGALAAAGGTDTRRRAGKVLRGLERLSQVLLSRGMPLPDVGDGLSRVLCEQLERLGIVARLSESSPPTHVLWGLPLL